MKSKPLILGALLFAAFLVNLDTTLVNVALPALVRELHATTTQLQWVVDAYNLVFAALLLTSAHCRTGSAARACCWRAWPSWGPRPWPAGSRARGGAHRGPGGDGPGAAMTFPATLSLISNVFTERRERARAIGLWGAIAGVAIAMGPIVGGWLLEHFTWVSIFIVMAPIAAAAVIVAALVLPASKDPSAEAPDIPGLILSAATMALLVFTIIEAPSYGWTAARSDAGFAGSAVLLAAFILREASRRAPDARRAAVPQPAVQRGQRPRSPSRSSRCSGSSS